MGDVIPFPRVSLPPPATFEDAAEMIRLFTEERERQGMRTNVCDLLAARFTAAEINWHFAVTQPPEKSGLRQQA